jgi:hypothetical protein
MSEIEYAEGNGKQGIGHDHQKDRLDHAVGTAPSAKTLKAGEQRKRLLQRR